MEKIGKKKRRNGEVEKVVKKGREEERKEL